MMISREAVLALMPHQTLTKLHGEPTHTAMKRLEKELAANLNAVEIQDLIEHIKDRYCHIDQSDLDANLEKFNQGIDPSVPLIAYIRKQEDCQEFANDGHVQISEETMITTGTKHALQCGAFTDAWREWNRIPRANRTWLAWKTHWTRAFEEQHTIQRLTGGEFSANSITRTDDELATQMVTSLDNLALAAIQKNETLEQLIKINEMKETTIKNLMTQLAAEKETSSKLLAIISKANLKTGGHNNSGGGGGNSSQYDPNGYCWSHGYKVTKNHTSKTCKIRKEGHKEGATRANTMGGSTDNIYWKPQT